VEDELSAARMLAKGLREQSYAVDVVADGEEALYRANINDYDLIILDILLPRKNGLEVCRQLRAEGSALPVLILTARDPVRDRIASLVIGADDYLTKPFDFNELLANAIQHTAERGEVRITLELCEGEYVITIADSGSGIPEEDQAHIFERFYRVDKARAHTSSDGEGGAGLGGPDRRLGG
jgi:DNA-binding response OmpR family regulator